MTRYVALIRGINVGATRKLPMAELRTACGEAGFKGVSSYIQSGNVVLSSDLSADAIAKRLGALITERFGLKVPVIVRSDAEWQRYAAGSPFPDAEVERPRLLHICPAVAPARAEAVAILEASASTKERIAIKDGTLWVDFGESVGTSKLTPALLDKAAGSPATVRNWNTVLKLAEMTAA